MLKKLLDALCLTQTMQLVALPAKSTESRVQGAMVPQAGKNMTASKENL